MRNYVARIGRVLATNPASNNIAILLVCAIIVIPIVMLYVLLDISFWKVLLVIFFGFIISAFLAIYGFARAATPVSPNQLLFNLLGDKSK
jgi:hypothetical protein